nr:cytochrome B561 and DOMON domain-containing protein At3g61750-like [Ipomoea batatas]GMD27840.1 cytochrome B561 and DOMON domain-containing protein At3g61750-like [Ipomoea batatas]
MGANFSFPEWQSAMSSLVALFLVMLIGFGIGNVVADEDEEFCRSNITSILPPPYGTMKNMICQNVWNTFTIRYSQTKDNVITIVLSAIYTTGWVGMGFSSDGMMLNSSCMVGWIPPGGKGQIRQYHVEGLMPSEIKHNKGELPLTKTPPLAVLHNGTIYLAFQLKYPSPLGLQPIILAYSTDYPHQDLRLTHHDDKTSIIFDFSSSSKSAAMESIKTVKMIHGVVTGFLLGFVTVIVGLQLYNQLDSDIPTHKGIGILLLVLSILRVRWGGVGEGAAAPILALSLLGSRAAPILASSQSVRIKGCPVGEGIAAPILSPSLSVRIKRCPSLCPGKEFFLSKMVDPRVQQQYQRYDIPVSSSHRVKRALVSKPDI